MPKAPEKLSPEDLRTALKRIEVYGTARGDGDEILIPLFQVQRHLRALDADLTEACAIIARLTAAGQALSEHADRTAGGCDCAVKNIACIHWATNTRKP